MMKLLVVEDDRKIKTEVIDDVLASLGYASDWATNQQDAIALLLENDYDLVLLDLQIPSRPQGTPNVEFGKFLLRKVHEIKSRGNLPVVVMTGYHHDCLDMASDLRDLGTETFIAKPFPAKGRTLATVIEETLAKFHRDLAQKQAPVGTFVGGEMVFYPHHIELCGVKVLGSKAVATRDMLAVLGRARTPDGSYKYFSGDEIADAIEAANGIGTVTGSARTIRGQASRLLKRHLNIDVGPQDILEHNDQGYRLNAWIEVVFAEDEGGSSEQANVASEEAGVVDGLGLAGPMKKRCVWIIDQLAKGDNLRAGDMEKALNCSRKTALRAFSVLKDHGLIGFAGSSKTGHYYLYKKAVATEF